MFSSLFGPLFFQISLLGPMHFGPLFLLMPHASLVTCLLGPMRFGLLCILYPNSWLHVWYHVCFVKFVFLCLSGPATPKIFAASVANKSLCFTWIQEGVYDRFQAKLFLPMNINYSEVYDNVTANGSQIEACIDFNVSLCPLTELRLELSVNSYNRTSEISNFSFYSGLWGIQ